MIDDIMEKYLGESFKIGKVYHQDFKNGERTFFKPLEKQKMVSLKDILLIQVNLIEQKSKSKKDLLIQHFHFEKKHPKMKYQKIYYKEI